MIDTVQFEKDIDAYIETLPGRKGGKATPGTKDKRRKILLGILSVLQASGHDEPDEGDYVAYRDSQSNNSDTIKDYETKIRTFFSWLTQERSNITTPMTQAEQERSEADMETLPIEEPSHAESVDAGTWPENEPTQNEPLPLKAVKGKGGRPKGEKRVQISVYLGQEAYDILRLMADINGASIGETAAQLLDRVAEKNRAKVQATAEAISKAKQGFNIEI